MTAVRQALRERGFPFDAERAVFLTVLHPLTVPGSDRSGRLLRDRRLAPIQSVRARDQPHLRLLRRAVRCYPAHVDPGLPAEGIPRVPS